MRARIGAVMAGRRPCYGSARRRQTESRSSPRTCAFPRSAVVRRSLLLVEYGGHTILRLGADGGLTNVWERPGCGPASLVQAGADLLVTCYDENTLVLV